MQAECTFSEALEATKGRVLFASGSPFPPCTYDGVERYPAQANNAYIFPCMGAAAMLCKCRSASPARSTPHKSGSHSHAHPPLATRAHFFGQPSPRGISRSLAPLRVLLILPSLAHASPTLPKPIDKAVRKLTALVGEPLEPPVNPPTTTCGEGSRG